MKCPKCESQNADDAVECSSCGVILARARTRPFRMPWDEEPAAQVAAPQLTAEAPAKLASHEPNRVGSREETRGSDVACVILGVLFLVVGLYFLLNPSNAGSDVANMHRLTLGETLSIMGAIFLAAGIRPRELLIDVWDSPKTAPAVTRSRPGTGVLCPVCGFVFDGEYGTEGWWCPTCGAVRH
jgi:uncharacterized membrane protein